MHSQPLSLVDAEATKEITLVDPTEFGDANVKVPDVTGSTWSKHMLTVSLIEQIICSYMLNALWSIKSPKFRLYDLMLIFLILY